MELSEEERKAIKDCDIIFINLEDMLSEESANDYRNSYKILKNLIDKQQRKLKEVEDYVTSHDFFNLLCTPYTPGKRKPYFIAHDKLLAILDGDDKDE